MKVGIVTFTDTSNCGAALQAYALNRKINEMGFEGETLQYDCENIARREKPCRFWEVKGAKAKLKWLLTIQKAKRKYDQTCHFLKTNAILSQESYNSSNIAKANMQYDKFIVGSDIIWELNVTGEDYTYFLDFVADNSKKYAYAASFGYDKIPEKHIEKNKEFLKSFFKIGVREHQGQNIIADILPQKETTLVCDPTLLIDSTQWEQIANAPINVKKDDYIFLYFVDPQGALLSKAKALGKQYNKKVIVYNSNIKKIPGVININSLSVEEFLTYIRNSFFVLTGSYHAVCFSVLFKRGFAFYNRAHSSRILTLSQELGLADRNLALNPDLEIEIDYSKVDPKLEKFKAHSEKFLLDILTN